MSAAPQYEPSAADLLEEAAARIVEPGWGDLAAEAIAAAVRRFDEIALTDELEEQLRLAGQLAAGRWTVGSALSVIDALPADFDPFGRCRPAEPLYRRPGVQHLAYESQPL